MAQAFLISMSLNIELDSGRDRHEVFGGDLSHQGPLRAPSAVCKTESSRASGNLHQVEGKINGGGGEGSKAANISQDKRNPQ